MLATEKISKDAQAKSSPTTQAKSLERSSKPKSNGWSISFSECGKFEISMAGYYALMFDNRDNAALEKEGRRPTTSKQRSSPRRNTRSLRLQQQWRFAIVW